MNFIISVLFGVLLFQQSQGKNDNSRIINGDTDTEGAYVTSFVAFFTINQNPNVAICSGAVINDVWILSAASCFRNLATTHVRYKTGQAPNGRLPAAPTGTTHYETGEIIHRIILHPSFNIATRANDIALVQTTAPIRNQGFIITRRAPVDYLPVTLSGYGPTLISNANADSSLLSQISSYLQNIALCRSIDASVPTNKLCSTDFTCMGDQGGPLVSNGELIGIISSPAKSQLSCGEYPFTTFTNVFLYRAWLIKTTGVDL